MESHFGHAGLEILKKGNIGFEDKMWESSAYRLSLMPWDWMRSRSGKRAAGTELWARPAYKVGKKRTQWRREGGGRLGGGKQHVE